jgi:segregation and condensation protein B
MSDNVLTFPGATPPEPDGPTEPPKPDELLMALEALLFSAGEPVTATELASALGEVDAIAVRDALRELEKTTADRGVRVVQISGGWQMRTDARFADAIVRLRGGRPLMMSRAALETLSVVAYRQPVTRQEIDDIRGVSSGGVVKTLIDKGYLRVVGRREEPGRPLEYGTTPTFLEMFELSGLDDLPTLAERAELVIDQPPGDLVVPLLDSELPPEFPVD